MKRKGLPWPGGSVTVLVILLLAGGWLAGQRLLPPAAPETEEHRETFREWLWGTRSLDLAVQVGIIFVGALGIAALLPRGDEDPPEEALLSEGPLALDDEEGEDELVMGGLENAAQGEPDDQF